MKFRPYGDVGPFFALTIWETGMFQDHKKRLGYALTARMRLDDTPEYVFKAQDFGCPVDKDPASNETALALMDELACHPESVRQGRLEKYDAVQMEFVNTYGEDVQQAAHELLDDVYDEGSYNDYE